MGIDQKDIFPAANIAGTQQPGAETLFARFHLNRVLATGKKEFSHTEIIAGRILSIAVDPQQPIGMETPHFSGTYATKDKVVLHFLSSVTGQDNYYLSNAKFEQQVTSGPEGARIRLKFTGIMGGGSDKVVGGGASATILDPSEYRILLPRNSRTLTIAAKDAGKIEILTRSELEAVRQREANARLRVDSPLRVPAPPSFK